MQRATVTMAAYIVRALAVMLLFAPAVLGVDRQQQPPIMRAVYERARRRKPRVREYAPENNKTLPRVDADTLLAVKDAAREAVASGAPDAVVYWMHQRKAAGDLGAFGPACARQCRDICAQAQTSQRTTQRRACADFRRVIATQTRPWCATRAILSPPVARAYMKWSAAARSTLATRELGRARSGGRCLQTRVRWR